MVKLYNVIDIRDKNFYSVEIVKERNVKLFREIEDEQ